MSLERLLKEELQKELPGGSFHDNMMPSYQSSINVSAVKYTKAAVSVIIYSPIEKTYQILLIKRADYNGHHSGQISFPGGKADNSDSTLLDTAIRETFEEIGIKLRKTEFLGNLTPLHIQISGFDVTPFVFYISKPRIFRLDKSEVQYLIQCNLFSILTITSVKTTRFRFNEYEIDAPYFDINGEIVWGATSMILSEFREILGRIERKNPGTVLPGF